MNRHYFISDAHLGAADTEDDRQRESRLLNFLKYVEDTGSSLYIVGDLFDFWFEYRTVIPRRYINVIFALKRLSDKGIKIEYVIGNHDFWLGDFFESQLGILIHHDPICLTIDSKRYYVGHGDGLAKDDVGYRFLKKILRHPLNIKLYRLLHPDFGYKLALFCSNLSRNHRAVKDNHSDYLSFARERFAEGFDGVILAHTHSPLEVTEHNKTYINTGDWINNNSYAVLEEGRLRLEKWSKRTV